jgi:PucR C-terminal helix-turn-helix domain
METTTPTAWAELPAAIVDRVRPHLPEVVDEVIAAVGDEVPAYRRPLEGDFGRGLRYGVEAALSRFLDLPGTSQTAASGTDRDVYVALGRGELRAGRSLEALLAAYRVGARVAFRRFAELARDAGLDADAIVPLAVATFAYIDELSSASIEGYAAEQSARAGEHDRLRAELLALILGGSADPAAVHDAARAVGWALPELIVPVVIAPNRSDGLSATLGPEALVAPTAESVVALLPAPLRPAQWVALRQRLVGRGAVVGIVAPWAEAAIALRPATLAMRLVADGLLDDDPVIVDDHLVDLIVHRDPQLTAALISRELAPLESVRDNTRERLAETLLAWLSYRGERARVADALHVHPQTVAYRLGQLRRLFGDALTDPDRRFALELALRAHAAAVNG